jgi:hypothetical protein
MADPIMGVPPGSGVNIDKNKKNAPVWQDFYKYLMDNWFSQKPTQASVGNVSATGAQPGDLRYVGVQDSGMAMATANLIQQRKLQQEEILRQLDAGNTGILQSPTVR